jgi:Leucine-rich repeat (LRR) protein
MNCAWLWSILTDAIIPVVTIIVAVICVYIAEYFAKKRDCKQKKIEVQIDYLRKEIEYLAKMENGIMTVCRNVHSCLVRDNPNERREKFNQIIGELSRLNEQNLSTYYMLHCFNESMNIGIDIVKYKKTIGQCTDKIYNIGIRYLDKPVNNEFEEELHDVEKNAIESIEEAIRLITDKMTLYLNSLSAWDERGNVQWNIKKYHSRSMML